MPPKSATATAALAALAWLCLPMTAAATPTVTSIGPQQDLGLGGNWARPHLAVNADGEQYWLLTWAFNNDLWAAELLQDGDSWSVDMDTARQLTERGDLIDHAIEQCPDGSWLHLASLNLDEPNDSAWSFVYDVDLNLVGSNAVEERNPDRAHNDMAIICGEDHRGVTFPDFGEKRTWYVPLADDGSPQDDIELIYAPVMTGGSLVEDPATGWLTAFGSYHLERLAVAQYDDAFEVVRSDDIDVDSGMIAWWPQGLVPVGDGWLTAYIAVADDDSGRDLDVGDVWLASLDQEFWLVHGDTVQGFDPPDGGHRPGLAYRDGLALVTYDSNNELFLHVLSVDPGDGAEVPDAGDGGAEEPGDGGADAPTDGGADQPADGGVDGPGDDSSADSGDPADPAAAAEVGCAGCSSASPAGALVLLWPAVLALVRRSEH